MRVYDLFLQIHKHTKIPLEIAPYPFSFCDYQEVFALILLGYLYLTTWQNNFKVWQEKSFFAALMVVWWWEHDAVGQPMGLVGSDSVGAFCTL